jgi:hypothetical protein
MIQRGTSLDLGLRAIFDILSTSELRDLSGVFANDAFLKFDFSRVVAALA